ncbi:MAG: HAMP domain-containing histidine kinase [Deltaproteobacteria bacterium]|jgi:signal transduction histidine kinase|nr:HAMP domain-containing histidine kinase [Deltaproteobacteria bacterium]
MSLDALTDPGQNTSRKQQLAADLRMSASRIAERAGGGLALIFVAAPENGSPENTTRLRAAAGFPVAETARDAAQALMATVREVITSGTEQQLGALPSLEERSKGGMLIVPMNLDDRCHGALAVGAPDSMQDDLREFIEQEASKLGLLLDHSRIRDELESVQKELAGLRDGEGSVDNSHEVLELSEALFAQDIELLRNNEKLGKIEKLKNDFIEKMSRELRTPLNSIIESIISVLTGENETLSDNSKVSLRAALDDGTEFLRTLQNILDLWKIKQRELPVEIQEVNFREVVDEAIFSVQDRISEKPVTVEQRFSEPFPKIRTDLAKVNQILFLLLENAVKFTARGQITITASLEDDQLKCEVKDTGIGICPDDQPHIFDEFFQVDELSSRTYAGAGLGLALVRDLVVLMDGDVAVKSDAGRGTAVTFQLPVQIVG